MTIRILPDHLINQIAAGEVVERPASVVKELIENALDAGADQILIDVIDGGRTLIQVIDNGRGMNAEDLSKSILRHATSKLPSDDLLDINFMGFRGEALPSIASVSNMTIDTRATGADTGLHLNAETGDIKPSSWESGTRIRVSNLFFNTPARLKFLRSDRAEMMSVTEVVKRLALARPDVGFTLNNKWRFPKGQPLFERVISVLGDEADGRMLEINRTEDLKLYGYISEPTLHSASSIDQYLFVNGRPVKDKVLVGALRGAYLDVMHAREFPLVALYLELSPREVDVNVSPAKTEVHFLEPARIRAFIIGTLRKALGQTLNQNSDLKTEFNSSQPVNNAVNYELPNLSAPLWTGVSAPTRNYETSEIGCQSAFVFGIEKSEPLPQSATDFPLGRPFKQIGNKYILSEIPGALVIIDQHAAHERIVYEKLRHHDIKRQPLLVPIIINLKPEQADAILEIKDELASSGLMVDSFGDNTIIISEKPADWDINWQKLFIDIAAEVMANGHSSLLSEKLHLKLANYACHHSVRAGQALDFIQMDKLLRDIENTERGGECNHGRPVYKIIPISEMDGWFERS